ncbi:TetR/AcrR family transcriptional regulator [Methylobacterium nodulans]|uniref:Transcriptional regulator, TetR family n=1 Tax=Methylobacterium nodulans (strain LMG 21967 / CNCM I-2342 / ORS 2060) TaxID=460265 RepID=B8IX44_METNO|nr:TetR/AcrR family transcriptional regulator [Methylobacterium nodulans]ACL63085.1 transcriptional regulator, TetR family [Methylobacterium nodulans ORS 2060]
MISGAQTRRRRKEARPAEITAAALSVFAEKGFAASRLEDVAERAGASKGTIYLYFDTKEALFEAVVHEAFAPLLDRVGKAKRDPRARSEDLLRLVIETIYRDLVGTDRRQILRMMIAEGTRFPHLVEFYHREAVSRGKALLGEIISQGIARGEFVDGPAARCPEVVIGPAIMAGVWKLVFERIERLDLDRFIAAHLDLVLNGLRAGSPTRVTVPSQRE